MEATHVHLVLNHIPIIGSCFGLVFLLIGLMLKNRTLEITGLCTLLFVALITIPTYLSGEEAEHMIEDLPGISEHQLEEHEEHAELSLWLMLSTGVLALFTLIAFYRAKHLLRTTRLATLVVGIFAFITFIPLANHGGKIVHQELRGPSSDKADAEDTSEHPLKNSGDHEHE